MPTFPDLFRVTVPEQKSDLFLEDVNARLGFGYGLTTEEIDTIHFDRSPQDCFGNIKQLARSTGLIPDAPSSTLEGRSNFPVK